MGTVSPLARTRHQGRTSSAGPNRPVNTASFNPFGRTIGRCFPRDKLAGSLGGAKRIVVRQLAEGGLITVFSSGSGAPRRDLVRKGSHLPTLAATDDF